MSRRPLLALLLLPWALPLLAAPARAIALVPDFSAESVTPGTSFNLPTAFCFTPGGRALVAEKAGLVWAVANGVKTGPLLDLSREVLNNGDRGLLGIAVDAAFPSDRYVYLYYAVDPDSDGVDDDGVAFARLTRYQVSAADSNVIDPASRTILLGADWSHGIPSGSDAHLAGALRFARDGSLLVSTGDGAQYVSADAGGLYGDLFLPGRIDPAQNVGAFRAQMLASLSGKILRLDPATGHGYPSNPWFDGDPTSNRSRVWAYGFRNPFRFTIRPGTGGADPAAGQPGVLYVGDVGWSTYESFDVATTGGGDFGWPCFEAAFANSPYQNAHPAAGGCATMGTAANPGPHVLPLMTFHHADPAQSLPPGIIGNCAIGGAFYGGALYPAAWQGGYFFADYGQGWLKVATMNAQTQVTGVLDFATAAEGPVDLATNPADGDVYYLAILAGELRHIRYTGPSADHAPLAVATASALTGAEPLAVQFGAASSSDEDGDPLTFQWTFGDGAGASGVTASHMYTRPGAWRAILAAEDGRGGIGSDTLVIVVSASGAFPTTALLDDFSRADGALGANWVGPTGALAISSGAVAPAAGEPFALWSAPAGADQEVFARLATLDAGATPELVLKAQGLDTQSARIRVRLDPAAARVTISRFVPDSGWVDAAAFAAPGFASGSRFGARAYENGVVTVFRDGAAIGGAVLGAWPPALATGRFGFSLAGSGPARVDDVGGGDAVIDPDHPPVVAITSPADSSFYATGDTLQLRGTASDAEDPADSLVWGWNIDLLHNNHVHPAVFSSAAHAAEYVAENHDDGTGVSLKISLAVTDRALHTTTRTVHTFPAVDLSPAGLAVRPAVVGTSSPAEYSFWLRDLGAMPAPRTHWVLRAGNVAIASGDTLAAAHDSVHVVVRATAALAAGANTLRVTADSLNVVFEPNETNNVAALPFTVVNGAVPDVLPPLFTLGPLMTPAGTSAWFRWKTDERSTATILYGASSALGESLAVTDVALDHIVQLAGLAPSTSVFERVVARDTLGNASVAPLDSFVTRASDLAVLPGGPARLALSSPWPDPARGAVALTLQLPRESTVQFAIYDVAGRLTWRAPVRRLEAGEWPLRWPGTRGTERAAPGVYLARVRAGEHVLTRRLVLLP